MVQVPTHHGRQWNTQPVRTRCAQLVHHSARQHPAATRQHRPHPPTPTSLVQVPRRPLDYHLSSSRCRPRRWPHLRLAPPIKPLTHLPCASSSLLFPCRCAPSCNCTLHVWYLDSFVQLVQLVQLVLLVLLVQLVQACSGLWLAQLSLACSACSDLLCFLWLAQTCSAFSDLLCFLWLAQLAQLS